jgi:peroxiredoxin
MNIGSTYLLPAAIAIVSCGWTSAAQQTGYAAQKNLMSHPSLGVRTTDGRTLKIEQTRGKVVLLDFMTTACPSCKMASIGPQRLYEELGPKGFQPIGIALNVESLSLLKEYGSERGLTFTLGTASRAGVSSYLKYPPDKPFLVPTLVLLDRRGRGWWGELCRENAAVGCTCEDHPA